MRPGDLLENPNAAGPMLGKLVDGQRIRATVKLRHRDSHPVTADIWVYRTRVATRDLNITISHPIGSDAIR